MDTVIQLPADLFFGTTIATCILILKKSKSDNKILFIDASAEFVRGSAIGDNDYNIAVSSYVEQKDTREVIDIKELNKKITGIVERQQILREEIDKIILTIA